MFLRGTTALLFLACSFGFGQDFNWPEDRLTAETKNRSYRDALDLGHYREAANHLHWLLINAPEISVSIYQHGAKIYEQLSLKESSGEQAILYADSALILYDLRMKYYGDSINVLNRKAFSAYKMLNRYDVKGPSLLKQYDYLFSFCGDQVMTSNLLPYMLIIKRYQNEVGSLSEEEITSRYKDISHLYDLSFDENGNGSIEKQKDLIDDIYMELVQVHCNFRASIYRSRWNRENKDLPSSKRIFSQLLQNYCQRTELYLSAAEVIFEAEPTFELSYHVLAHTYIARNEENKALFYLKKSVDLAKDQKEVSDIYLEIGGILVRQSKLREAKEAFLASIENDEENTDAYMALGDLYFANVSDCAEEIERRAVYILASEMYEKAGNEEMRSNAKQQFPSKAELFELNLKSGDMFRIGCWIDMEVELETRD